ncbi:hypothetical protein DFH06DRAFT_946412, partial [Mycena polygramma]
VPFVHWIVLRSEKGESVCIMALFDGGAQVGAIDKAYFEKVRRRMGKINAPTKRLKMADGSVVDSVANWEGEIEIDGVRARGAFEVFDSGGGWKVLFGKPLQASMGVVHDMRRDIVTLNVGACSAELYNQNPQLEGDWKAVWRRHVESGVSRREASTGVQSCAMPPARPVL